MKKIRASQCEIKRVSKDEEQSFLNENHYQGYIVSEDCLGLYFNGELLELMSFGTPRFNTHYDVELLRLCTRKEYQVYGGASKLFNAYYTKGSVISYCNESKFTGQVYNALGFEKINTCVSYHYEKGNEIVKRYSAMKSILVKKYPQWKDLSERTIMTEKLGYTRVEEIQATYVYNKVPVQYYIYKVTIDKYTYIGQHRYYDDPAEDNYIGSGTILKRLLNKYSSFRREILISGIKTKDEINRLEIQYIADDKLANPFNVNIQNGGQSYRLHGGSRGNYGANKGMKHSEETKRKIGEKSREIWKDPEYRALQSSKRKGKVAWNRNKTYHQKNTKYKENALEQARKDCPNGWILLVDFPEKRSRQYIFKYYEHKHLYDKQNSPVIIKAK